VKPSWLGLGKEEKLRGAREGRSAPSGKKSEYIRVPGREKKNGGETLENFARTGGKKKTKGGVRKKGKVKD